MKVDSLVEEFLESAGYNYNLYPLEHESGLPIIELIPKFRQDWDEYERDRLELNVKFGDRYLFGHPDFIR